MKIRMTGGQRTAIKRTNALADIAADYVIGLAHRGVKFLRDIPPIFQCEITDTFTGVHAIRRQSLGRTRGDAPGARAATIRHRRVSRQRYGQKKLSQQKP